MHGVQLIVLVSTIIIALLSAILAMFLSYNYAVVRKRSYLFWATGMWLFTFGVVLEIVFAFGVENLALNDIYLFVVAVLVEALALGSVYLYKNAKIKLAYFSYSIIMAILNVVVLAYSNVGNIISNYVVYGPLPLGVVVASSLATFPAAAVLIASAALGFAHGHSRKMLSIIAGTVVVSIAGTLYIAAYPEFLYYAEFIGIVLLWLGFFDFNSIGIGRKRKVRR